MARTVRWPAWCTSLFLVFVIVALAPWAALVPLAALAAILFFVAWNMADLRHVSRLMRTAPLADRFLLFITFVLTVFVDLVVAVNVGVVIAALLFMRRMAETVQVGTQEFNGAGAPPEPPKTSCCRATCWSIASKGRCSSAPPKNSRAHWSARISDVDTVVIRLGRVPFVDATGLNTLAEIVQRFQRRKVRVLLCGIHAQLRAPLEAAGVTALVGADNICRNMEEVARRVAKWRPELRRLTTRAKTGTVADVYASGTAHDALVC